MQTFTGMLQPIDGYFDMFSINKIMPPSILSKIRSIDITIFGDCCAIHVIMSNPLRSHYRFCLRDSNGVFPNYLFSVCHFHTYKEDIHIYGFLAYELINYHCYNNLIVQYSDNGITWHECDPQFLTFDHNNIVLLQLL